MAATTVLTASNGWKFRPLEETAADQDFYIRCWKDFPQGSNTYIARLNRFSWHLSKKTYEYVLTSQKEMELK